MSYDQRSFELMLRNRLSKELNMNAADKIKAFTKLAEENINYYYLFGLVICELISEKKENIAINYFYLIDSIVKNLSNKHYNNFFADRIGPLFVQLFNRSQNPRKRELKHLLKTWEDNKVFKITTIEYIHKNDIYGESKKRRLLDANNKWRQLAKQITTSRKDLEPILKVLHKKLHKEIDIEEGISKLVKALKSPPMTSYQQNINRPVSQYIHTSSNIDPYQSHQSYNHYNQPKRIKTNPSNDWNVSVTTEPLYNNNNNNNPINNNIMYPPSYNQTHQSHVSSLPISPALNNNDLWDSRVLNMEPNNSVAILYALNSNKQQCSICGLRRSEEEMKEHLDWHFRMNQREERRKKGPVHQEWFIETNEWIDRIDFFSEKQVLETPAIEMESDKEEEEEEIIHTVRIESNDTNLLCPICHTKFDQVFSEDEDSWVYQNAIRDQDTNVIIHEHCRVDDDAIMINNNNNNNNNSDEIFSTNNKSPPPTPKLNNNMKTPPPMPVLNNEEIVEIDNI